MATVVIFKILNFINLLLFRMSRRI